MILLIQNIKRSIETFGYDLHFTMILLIRKTLRTCMQIYLYLHFTMILLILYQVTQEVNEKNQFTFHYDSINSIVCHISNIGNVNLHFTMILLILKKSEQYSSLYCDLHFTMILLILVILDELTEFFDEFTFHYDSINSRSKIIPLSMPQNILILSTSSKFNMSFFSLIIYSRNTSYFRHFRLLSIPYIFCTIIGQQKLLTFQFNFI